MPINTGWWNSASNISAGNSRSRDWSPQRGKTRGVLNEILGLRITELSQDFCDCALHPVSKLFLSIYRDLAYMNLMVGGFRFYLYF